MHSEKNKWKTPDLSSFETPEEVLAYYGPKATAAELEKLKELLEQMAIRDRG